MRTAIVGAGVAGPTLAYWLVRAGHEVVLVERAPAPRAGGYVVDFWGAGYDVAERMGVVDDLERRGFRMSEGRSVTASGRRIAALDPSALVAAAGGRYISIARSDLAEVLLDAVADRVELIRGDTVAALDDAGDRVRVELESGAHTEADLVVGADGLHSRVRRLVFGPEDCFERSLGIVVAAFEVDDHTPYDEGVAVMHAGVGYQVVRVGLAGGRTLFLLTVRHEGALPDDAGAQQALLRERLAGVGWEVPRILDAMPEAATFYCDRVSQIRMPSWTRGRVALVGDAAACVSLLAGQGSALAMVEAYVLGSELARSDGHPAAFARYEQRLAGFLRAKQDAATGLGTVFAPANRVGLLVRNVALALTGLPRVGSLIAGRSLYDAVELPGFPAGREA